MVTGGAAVSTPNMANGPAPAAQEGCVPSTVLASASSEMALMSPRRASESRRSNKPIMEKRRRARINNCLNELKTLILDAMKKDPARHSKLEKADILEMTVRHLESIQRKNAVLASATDPNVMNKFRAGFNECATEVSRFPGLEPSVRRRLLQHLSTYLNGPEAAAAAAAAASAIADAESGLQSSPTDQNASTGQAVQIHIVPSGVQNKAGGNLLLTTSAGTIQLMPTALGNSKLAVILPSLQSPPSSPSSSRSSPPPSPSSPLSVSLRTSSTASSSSIVSASTSPVAFERLRVESPPGQLQLLLPLQMEEQPQNLSQRDAFSPVSLSSPHSPSSVHFSLSPLSNSGASSCDALRPYSPDDMQKPLALVTRRNYNIEAIDEERPWRPW